MLFEQFPSSGSLTFHTPGIFDKFETTLEIREDQTVIQQVTRGPIPTEFTEFDPEINVVNSDLQDLHIEVGGPVSFSNSTWSRSRVVVRVVAGPEARGNYLLHDMPQEILDAVGITDLNDLELAGVTATKVGDASYDDVFKTAFQNEIKSNPHVLYKWINF